jgi:hypothetical protein
VNAQFGDALTKVLDVAHQTALKALHECHHDNATHRRIVQGIQPSGEFRERTD